ncbi:FUSC family protein [Frigoribacterium faeni]|nr:FUSC family protein [Frigoribacterium faeni]MCJ0701799.1 FUSC family protein [Frigoribacterium faeni]MDY0890684.1 FUSC family protein [Frigoribacterium sp. CFBP9030]
MGVASRIRQSKRTPLLQVVKTSAAVIAAWFASVALLQQPLPIFAAIAALLVVLPSVNQSFVRGLERSVGVIAGVLIAFAAGLVFGDATWIVLVIVVVSLLVAWAFRLTPSSANQVPISAMLVLAIGAQTPDYALDRVLETIIGAAIALAVNALIVPPVLLAPAHLAVGRLARDIASVLDETAAVLSEPVDAARLRAGLDDARALRAAQARASSAVTAGVESLQLNPRASRNRSVLEADGALLDRLTVLVNRVVGMVRSVHDNYDPGLADDPVVQSIAEDLRRAAHDVRLLARTTEEARPADTGRPASSTPSPSPDDTPALTSPVQVLRPDPDNWVLVGSLLEDLRRVREEIIG